MYIVNTGITMIAQFLIALFSFAFGIAVARLLGPSGKGLFAIVIMVVGIAQQLVNPSLHTANKYFVKKAAGSTKSLLANSIWWSVFTAPVAIGGILLVFHQAPGWFPGVPASLIWTALPAVPAVVAGLLLFNLAMGLERFVYYNVVDLLYRVFMLVMAVLLLAVLGRGVHSLVATFSVGSWLVVLAMLFYFSRLKLLSCRPNFKLLKESLGYGRYWWLAGMAGFLLLRFDMLIINYYTGAEGAGWYSVAVGIADALLLLPIVIGTTLFPRIAALTREQGDVAFGRLIQTFIPLFLLATVAMVLLFRPFVRLLYGDEFLPAIPAFYALAPGIFFLGIERVYSASLGGRGVVKFLPLIWWTCFIVNIVTTIPMVKAMGIVGAGYASSISYFLAFVLILLYHHRHSDLAWTDQFVPRMKNIKLIIRELFFIMRSFAPKSGPKKKGGADDAEK